MILLVALVVFLPLAFLLRAVTDSGWRPIASLEELRERDVVYLPDIRVFLVDGEPPIAVAARSSHLGHPVAFCRSSQGFEEIHGAKFDRQGVYLDGPATHDLDRVATRVRAGVVEINVQRVTPGAPRGSRDPLPPAGPFCAFDVQADGTDGFLDPVQIPG